MILNRTMAEVEQNKGSQNSHTSTTEPIQSSSWFILHHEQCHTATYKLLTNSSPMTLKWWISLTTYWSWLGTGVENIQLTSILSRHSHCECVYICKSASLYAGLCVFELRVCRVCSSCVYVVCVQVVCMSCVFKLCVCCVCLSCVYVCVCVCAGVCMHE